MEPAKLIPPTKDEINRLIKQSYGENGFVLLSLCSFIEAYIRHNFSEYAYQEKKSENAGSFAKLLQTLEDYESPFQKNWKLHNLYNQLISIHKKYANSVRHDFAEIDNIVLSDAINKFIKFAKEHHFDTPEILKLDETIACFEEIKKKLPPSGNQIQALINANTSIEKKYKDKIEQFDEQLKIINSLQEQNKTLEDEIEEKKLSITKIQEDADQYLLNTKLILSYTKDYRDYQTRILTLSQDQSFIVDKIVKHIDSPQEKDFLIKGGPGTGKTLVLIKILEHLAEKDVVLLTYTSSLSKYNRYISQLFIEKENQNSNVKDLMINKIFTFDGFFKNKIEKILDKEIFFLNTDTLEDNSGDLYNVLLKILEKNSLKFAPDVLLKQAVEHIWPNLLTKNEYIKGTYITNEQVFSDAELKDREIIWDSLEKSYKDIDNMQAIPAVYAYWKLNTDPKFNEINDIYKNDLLLIDEVQDLTTARIELLSKLTRKNCVMAGDLNQSIFIKRGLSWRSLGHKVQGHTHTLRTNYRSSMPIQNLANKYRESCKVQDMQVISQSYIPGPMPELIITESNNKAYQEVLNKILWCKNVMNYSNKEICVVATNDGEISKIQELLSKNELKSGIMEDKSFDFNNAEELIRLSTIKYVKGIDTPILIFLMTEALTNRKANGNLEKHSQMNSIYACITRAMDKLIVISTKDARKAGMKGPTSSSILIDIMESDSY